MTINHWLSVKNGKFNPSTNKDVGISNNTPTKFLVKLRPLADRLFPACLNNTTATAQHSAQINA